MGEEINSASVLLDMLVELRQENRQLAGELSTAQMLLRTLQAAAVPGAGDGQNPPGTESLEQPANTPRAWPD